MQIVSYGAGVNSTALLVGLMERGIRPDAILFSDTGGEKPETYQHLEQIKRWCLAVGFPAITVVSYDTSRHGSLENECLNNETLPSKAFGYSGCSWKWKRQPMDRWIGQQPECGLVWQLGEKIDRLIGIHAGEKRRGKIPDTDKYHFRYPLKEWGWGQVECETAIARNGLPLPCKSACFFCPAMRKVEVLQLAIDHPELMQRALEIEANAIEAGTLETVKGLGRHWTWAELLAADQASRETAFPDNQAPLCDVCMDE